MNTQTIKNRKRRLSRRFPTELPNEVVESQTQKIPNLVFLGLAGVSVISSLMMALKAKDRTDFANFIGQWAPTLLLFGVYNKIVKLESEVLPEGGSRALH